MCLMIGGLFAQSASAHPHSWIDMKADMILDEQGRLVAITQHWSFDTYFSMMTLADAVSEHGNKEIGLRKMASKIIDNLTEHRYFSELTVDGLEIELPQPTSYRLSEYTGAAVPTLQLEMRFDITQSPTVSDKNLAWSVFDPTYYIAMNFSNVTNVSIRGAQAEQCQLQLDLPQPDFELIQYAQSLDQTRRDTDGLGIHFAETVRINCLSGASQ